MARGRKTGGRKPGSKNKLSFDMREKLNEAANNYGLIDKIFTDLDSLEPRERIKAMTSILPYLMPRLSTLDVEKEAATALPQIIIHQAPED
jgi:hypothetical protein